MYFKIYSPHTVWHYHGRYFSLKRQYICLVYQKAQSKKGKVAEKSPQEEQLPSGPLTTDAGGLNQKIMDQGNVVRKLKGDKAPKVGSVRGYLLSQCFDGVYYDDS